MPPTSAKKRRNGTRGPANTEALLAAAHRLVAERGSDFTTQDLVKEADVALQTFYRHFGGKDQILLAVVADLIDGHCRRLAREGEGIDDPVERLCFYLTETVVTVRGPSAAGARFMTSEHWRLHQELPTELVEANKPFADLVQAALEEGQASGAVASVDPERDAWMINKLVMAVFHHYAFAEDDPSAASIADEVVHFCLTAVGAEVPTAKKRTPTRRR